MGKGSKRRQENFRAVQDNWPKNMGPKNTWSEFSDKFYEENKELLDAQFLDLIEPTGKGTLVDELTKDIAFLLCPTKK